MTTLVPAIPVSLNLWSFKTTPSTVMIIGKLYNVRLPWFLKFSRHYQGYPLKLDKVSHLHDIPLNVQDRTISLNWCPSKVRICKSSFAKNTDISFPLWYLVSRSSGSWKSSWLHSMSSVLLLSDTASEVSLPGTFDESANKTQFSNFQFLHFSPECCQKQRKSPWQNFDFDLWLFLL